MSEKRSLAIVAGIVTLSSLSLALPALAAVELPRCDRRSPDAATTTQLSPYKATTIFQEALKKITKLQHPTSGECLDLQQIKDGYIKKDRFYAAKVGKTYEMRFRLPSDARAKSRTELRGNNFTVTTNAQMTFDYVIPTGTYADGFTIGQMLSNTSETNSSIASIPILRLEVIKSYNKQTNHLWAVYKTSETGNATYTDLGAVNFGSLSTIELEWADGGTVSINTKTGKLSGTGKIRVKHNTTSKNFAISGITLPATINQVYFKTGCYTQSDGACANNIRKLVFAGVPNV